MRNFIYCIKVALVYAKNVLKTAIFSFGKNPRSDRPRLPPAASRLSFLGSVADPHHIDANADPDPACSLLCLSGSGSYLPNKGSRSATLLPGLNFWVDFEILSGLKNLVIDFNKRHKSGYGPNYLAFLCFLF